MISTESLITYYATIKKLYHQKVIILWKYEFRWFSILEMIHRLFKDILLKMTK